MGRSAEKLLRRIETRRAELKEKIDYAMGDAGQVAAYQEELLVLDWAVAGSKVEA